MGVSSPTKIQAKHIPYGMVIEAVRGLAAVPKVRIDFHGNVIVGGNGYVNLQMLQDAWPTVPPKVIQAKLRKLIEKYHMLEGCACGCSAGITVNEKALYHVVGVFGPGNTYSDRIEPGGTWRPEPKHHEVFTPNVDVFDRIREDFDRRDV